MTPDRDNPYKILGVGPTDDLEAITAAYRAKAKQHHPDRNRQHPEQAKQNFQLIQLAFDVLRDPVRRKRFDEHGYMDERTTPSDGGQAEVHQLLATVLHQVFQSLLDAGQNPEQHDLIDWVRRSLDRMISETERAIAKQEKTIQKLQAAAKRFQHKENNPLLPQMLLAPVVDIQRSLDQGQEHLAKAKAAYAIVKAYRFDVAAGGPQTMRGGSGWFGGMQFTHWTGAASGASK